MGASRQSIEMGKGHVTLGTDQSQLDKGLEQARAKFQAWGKSIAAMGAGIVAAATLITAPFLTGLSVFSKWGDEIVRASRLTGMSFESVQSTAYGLRTDLEGLTAGVG